MGKQRKLEVSDVVVYHDELNHPRNALVLAVHGEVSDDWVPCLNIVTVRDEKHQDTYGRQVEHLSSVSHMSSMGGTPGNYWRWPDEVPVEYKAPAQT